VYADRKINIKFYNDNKVSLFLRERLSRRDSFGKRELPMQQKKFNSSQHFSHKEKGLLEEITLH